MEPKPKPALSITLVRRLREGFERGIAGQVARGMPREEAIARAERNVGEFGAYLASPDFNVRTAVQPAEAKSEREALLEEIKTMAGGYVYSKWPSSASEYDVIETHNGKQAPFDILNEIAAARSHPDRFLSQVFPRPLPLDHNNVRNLYIKYFETYGVFCFTTTGTGTDSFGREYYHFVFILLPHEIAEKLFHFIMREDPNFVLDIYKAVFPQNYLKNRISLSGKMSFVKDGQRFAVPNFMPASGADKSAAR